MPDEQLPIRVVEVAIDPKWRLVQIVIDTQALNVLRIEHPQHGMVDCLMPRSSMEVLRDSLIELTKGEEWSRSIN